MTGNQNEALKTGLFANNTANVGDMFKAASSNASLTNNQSSQPSN